jgi:hypothetical protein
MGFWNDFVSGFLAPVREVGRGIKRGSELVKSVDFIPGAEEAGAVLDTAGDFLSYGERLGELDPDRRTQEDFRRRLAFDQRNREARQATMKKRLDAGTVDRATMRERRRQRIAQRNAEAGASTSEEFLENRGVERGIQRSINADRSEARRRRQMAGLR